MTNNNSIADELIYGQKNIQDVTPQQEGNDVKEERISSRVVSTRYKIYVLLFILVGVLLFYKFLLPAYDSNKASKVALDKVQEQVDNFEDKKRAAQNNVALLKLTQENQEKIVSCINNDSSCDILTGKNSEEIKDLMNLNNLSNNKMVIDEKKILANLNEFLLKKTDDGGYNGSIEAVHIGEEEKFDEVIYFSPLDLKIAFDNKDDLLSFVDNIEKKVLDQKEYRILYQIENIKYDILKSQEKQSVDIEMYMFYTR